MADQNAGKHLRGRSLKSDAGEEVEKETDNIGVQVASSSLASSRPRREKKKQWPPRSPPQSPPLTKKTFQSSSVQNEEKSDVKEEFHPTIEVISGSGVDGPVYLQVEDDIGDDECPEGTTEEGGSGDHASGFAIEDALAPQKNPQRKGRSKGQDWQHVCSLDSEETFQKWKHDSEQKITPGRWAKKRMNETKLSVKRYFHCSVIGCKAELTVMYPNYSEKVEVLHNGKAHFHPPNQKKWGLSSEAKQEVRRLWESGVQKPRYIRASLEKLGLGDCTVVQLRNFLERLKKRNKLPTPTLPINSLEEWCAEHSITKPTAALVGDVDRVYVFDHHTDARSRQFRFILSSKRLMKFAAQASTLSVDASHRMKWFGAPVLFVGVSDVNGMFFPVMFAVISHETADNYLQMLTVLKKCVEASSGTAFQPSCVIGNGDPNVADAVKSVFPNAARRMCWLQVKKELSALLKPIDKEIRDTLEKDVGSLRLSCDQKQFELAAKLMLEKWRGLLPSSDLPGRFEERFVKLHPEWYEGFDVASQSSNRGLMHAVNAVKNRHTLRERLPPERYLTLAQELVLEWSCGVSEIGQLEHSITPDTELLSDTYQLQTDEKTMVDIDSAIYVPVGDQRAATVKEVEAFEKKMGGEVKSFDEFVEARMSLWKVVDTGDKSDISHMRCSCPKFFSAKLCEHILAIGSALGLVTLPPPTLESDQCASEGKRKRGRPSKKKSETVNMVVDMDCSDMRAFIETGTFTIE
ncbi:uncharacterized protein LOC122374521 isoform X1 [Amphibalanus amphitrite]|uniref:uncharacterized protein LOC122374521 isoform X1 n=1 Tax=Amphibalanus amphitrite TaxID=1232801 RepID=UPI001C92852C|nr:uncharacterized protein LOC122374521 isoform X1 [Amphibalanus amphitrite]